MSENEWNFYPERTTVINWKLNFVVRVFLYFKHTQVVKAQHSNNAFLITASTLISVTVFTNLNYIILI